MSVSTVSRSMKPPFGFVTYTKEAIFQKGIFFWLYLDKYYGDYPWYGYTIYWLDIIRNEWGFFICSYH